VYTDGSKIRDNIGAAGIIFVNGKLVHQLKFKLHGHCSNNQAEQTAILKVLGKLEKPQVGQDNDKTRCNIHGQQDNSGFTAKHV
jgi:ribonuclease HI